MIRKKQITKFIMHEKEISNLEYREKVDPLTFLGFKLTKGIEEGYRSPGDDQWWCYGTGQYRRSNQRYSLEYLKMSECFIVDGENIFYAPEVKIHTKESTFTYHFTTDEEAKEYIDDIKSRNENDFIEL